MILLDTNVVSELMRPQPSQAVLDWFASQSGDHLFLSSVTEAELRLGALLLPNGARRDQIKAAIGAMLKAEFDGRILPFDSLAAQAYADIVALRREAGRPISAFDAQIAAIAFANGFSVATRNIRDFEGSGVNILNPWDATI
jgi:predicted nucleic acid-binding protein